MQLKFSQDKLKANQVTDITPDNVQRDFAWEISKL